MQSENDAEISWRKRDQEKRTSLGGNRWEQVEEIMENRSWNHGTSWKNPEETPRKTIEQLKSITIPGILNLDLYEEGLLTNTMNHWLVVKPSHDMICLNLDHHPLAVGLNNI
jgi:hypothetical protein